MAQVTPKPTTETAFVTAQAGIELAHKAEQALEFLMSFVYEDAHGREDRWVQDAFHRIHAEVYRRELEAWRRAMTWGLLAKPADRKAIMKLVAGRFLKEGMGVMHHLYGHEPASWLSSDEIEFREAIKAAIREREAE